MEVAKPDVVSSLQQSLQILCLKQQNSFRVWYDEAFIGATDVHFFFKYVPVPSWWG